MYADSRTAELHRPQSNGFPLDDNGRLPDSLPKFWESWYLTAQEWAHDFPRALSCLEELLLRSDDEILTHAIAGDLLRALRFWALQVQRQPGAADKAGSKPIKTPRSANLQALQILEDTWTRFQKHFLQRIQRQSMVLQALAIPYSFSSLALLEAGGEGAAQRDWPDELQRAKFHKTIGQLSQAEKILQALIRSLGQASDVYSAALFELCDIYTQTEQHPLCCLTVRQLLLQDPSFWDLSLASSQFCCSLQQSLPPNSSRAEEEFWHQFAVEDFILLSWGGLYALAEGAYGMGSSLSHQQQKNYWGQIFQLKKAISSPRQAKSSPSLSSKATGARVPLGTSSAEEFQDLQRAQLLVYYILILEHLHWARQAEKSAQALEENSALWQNVMIEIYSLSEDISVRCKNRFSRYI